MIGLTAVAPLNGTVREPLPRTTAPSVGAVGTSLGVTGPETAETVPAPKLLTALTRNT